MAASEYARGREWYVEARKPAGGFCFLHYERVLRTWQALVAGDLQLRDVRVWLACHELTARRCNLPTTRRPRYGLDELKRLVGGVGGEHLRASIRRLERGGHLSFTEAIVTTSPGNEPRGRLVPVARPLLRMLTKARGRAFIATTLGHLLRCVFYRTGVCRSGGWCKASWVAETFGVGLRAVREARARLVGLGVLRLLAADQTRLNRYGKPVVVDFDWHPESAPQARFSTTESAPPREHKKLSLRRVEHQKPARAAVPAGVHTHMATPRLNAVQMVDLEDPRRLRELFKQAHASRLVTLCEADILAVFGAAAHATRVSTHNPPGLFYWMVSAKRWEHISGRDEDHARKMLRQLREYKSPSSVGKFNPRDKVRCVAS
jgi:hypothetical protein